MPKFIKDRTILKIDVIKELLDNAEVQKGEDGDLIQTIYLGDIRSITPSGKIYYPFACSNVTPCPKCRGTGSVKNPNAKLRDWLKAHMDHAELLEKINQYPNWFDAPKHLRNKLHKRYKQLTQWQDLISCNECSGLGSLEARLDQDWHEQLDYELDKINAWSHGSDGDGCDIMISRMVDDVCEDIPEDELGQ